MDKKEMDRQKFVSWAMTRWNNLASDEESSKLLMEKMFRACFDKLKGE